MSPESIANLKPTEHVDLELDGKIIRVRKRDRITPLVYLIYSGVNRDDLRVRYRAKTPARAWFFVRKLKREGRDTP